jgi:tetratricopeptide (TPR) repeat protein
MRNRLKRLAIIALVVGAAASEAGLAFVQETAAPRAKAGQAGSPASPKAEFERLRAEAEQAFDSDQVQKAVELYARLVKMRPQWVEGWWRLGTAQYELDQYPAARDAFRKVVVLEPPNGQGWGMLGLCEYQTKDLVASLQHLTKARTLGLGGNEELARAVRYHQAMLLIRGRQFNAALGILRSFAVEKRESPSVLDAMGLAVLQISDPPESLSPDRSSMVREFGQAAFLEAERKSVEAARAFKELEGKYRGEPAVEYAYGVFLAGQGQTEEALNYFRKELEREPHHVPSLLQLASGLLQLERFEAGLPFGLRAVELDPENPTAYYLLGRTQLYLGDVKNAVATLEKGVSLAPGSAMLHYSLSQAYLRAGRPEEAARARAEFVRLDALEKRQPGEAPETR